MEEEPSRLIANNIQPVTAFLHKNEELQQSTFQPIEVLITLIQSSVPHPNSNKEYKLVEKSIIEQGLQNPVIVIPNTAANFTACVKNVKGAAVKRLQTKPLLAYTGNQRLDIARKLKYDTISVIIAEDVYWAHSYQLTIQKGIINHVLETPTS